MAKTDSTEVAVSSMTDDQLSGNLPIAGSYDYEKQLLLLKPDEVDRLRQMTAKIDYKDLSTVQEYGSELSSVISSNGDMLLKSVRADNTNEVVQLTNELLAELNMIDIDQLNDTTWRRFCRKMPLLRKFTYKVQKIFDEYDTISANVEKISKKMSTAKLTALRDNSTLQQIFDNNVIYIEKLRELILAAKIKLKDIDADMERMEKDASIDAWQINDVKNIKNEMEKKIADMETHECILTQNLYQIRATQHNNISISNKSDSIVNNMIPVWKSQLALSVIMNNQKASVDAQRRISDATNEMFRKNAALLKTNSVDVARESERQLVDLATLQDVTQKLVETINEVKQIHEQGAKNRKAIETSLQTYSDQLQKSITGGTN